MSTPMTPEPRPQVSSATVVAASVGAEAGPSSVTVRGALSQPSPLRTRTV